MFESDAEYEVRMVIEELRGNAENELAKELLDVYMRNFTAEAEGELNIDLGIVYCIALLLEKAPINIKQALFETVMEAAMLLMLFGDGD